MDEFWGGGIIEKIPKFETDNKNRKGESIKVEYTDPEIDMEVIEKLGEFLEWFDRRE